MMLPNGVLLILTALVSAGLVVLAWRHDKERLYSAILIFLILIAILGGKIVDFFGFATNTGNVFYASVFLATYFLIERYGKREGVRSILIGVVGVFFFSVLLELALLLSASSVNAPFSEALTQAFSPVSRLAFASLLAYAASQTLNVHLYIYLKQRMQGANLWLRANLCNAAAQLLDSVIFFTVAFSGVVLPENLAEIILTGLVIKIAFMMLAAPLLYLNRVEEDDDGGFGTVRFR